MSTNNIIKIVLAVACLVVAYFCYESIAKPMRYEKEVRRIEADIIERLMEIKDAQFAYREAYGHFANNFDTLVTGIQNGRIAEVKQEGELLDSTSKVEVDTIYVPITEKLQGKITNYDSLRYVPHSNKVEFKMQAGTLNRNGVDIQVFQVEDPKPFNKKRALRLGSMTDAIYTGNWEKLKD